MGLQRCGVPRRSAMRPSARYPRPISRPRATPAGRAYGPVTGWSCWPRARSQRSLHGRLKAWHGRLGGSRAILSNRQRAHCGAPGRCSAQLTDERNLGSPSAPGRLGSEPSAGSTSGSSSRRARSFRHRSSIPAAAPRRPHGASSARCRTRPPSARLHPARSGLDEGRQCGITIP